MKPEEFTAAMTESLVERGVPEDLAGEQVRKLFSALAAGSLHLLDAYDSKESLAPVADELAGKILAARAADETPAQKQSDGDVYDVSGGVTHYDGDGAYASANGYYSSDGDFYAGGGYFVDDASQGEEPLYSENDDYANDSGVDGGYGNDDAVYEDDVYTMGRVMTPEEMRENGFYVQDDIDEYAPNEETLTQMGIPTDSGDAYLGGGREKYRRDILALPPLPELHETEEGRRKFAVAAICLSPFIVIAAMIYFSLWGAVFAFEAALIAGFIIALVAVAAGGAVASLGSIIYGIVKLSTQRSEGIFEIGLGIAVAGATLLAGVLVYNFALRFMPWAIKKTARLCRFTARMVHILILNIRGRFSAK